VIKKALFKLENVESKAYPVKLPDIPVSVVPKGVTPPVMAMDTTLISQMFPGGGFPGFAYLSQLSTRAEYRQMASSMAVEITREWIDFTNAGDKLKPIQELFEKLNVRGVIRKAAEQDCYFGKAHIYLEILGADDKTPLILDPKTIKKGSFKFITNVESIWTTPSAYDAINPKSPHFYKPERWYVMGQEIHGTRLLTITTRPLSDVLKPAYNFAGMSLSQLAEPYVDNWLRTRQSVSDLISNFSTTVLATRMDQVLQGDDDGSDMFARAELFTATRSNKGLMLLDKETEELIQVNTPLSGLHELQAQSQEHLCSVSRIPAMILTGISPSGLNASSDGEIRVFYDWIAAIQESDYRKPIDTILKIAQLSLFGEIDPNIGFKFNPLYQMTVKEQAEIREIDSRVDCAYIDRGVIDPTEIRTKLVRDPENDY
jgi:uncharacterized protein